uniref:Uncharacterized protein n=1 Tax=Cercocebus atys TaxID=9531 RepID=A0A2K5NC85_CERAT
MVLVSYFLHYFQGCVSHQNLIMEELNFPGTPMAGLPDTSLNCSHSHFQTRGLLWPVGSHGQSQQPSLRPRKLRYELYLRLPWPLLYLQSSLGVFSLCLLPAPLLSLLGFIASQPHKGLVLSNPSQTDYRPEGSVSTHLLLL